MHTMYIVASYNNTYTVQTRLSECLLRDGIYTVNMLYCNFVYISWRLSVVAPSRSTVPESEMSYPRTQDVCSEPVASAVIWTASIQLRFSALIIRHHMYCTLKTSPFIIYMQLLSFMLHVYQFRYLQQNLLSKIENVEHLQQLDTLNVSNNTIYKIENISKLNFII